MSNILTSNRLKLQLLVFAFLIIPLFCASEMFTSPVVLVVG